MWRFYPKSFPMLILAGFSLAVLPLIFALINNAMSIHELATKSQRAVYNAVQATQNSRLLIEQLTSMERSARQYSILGDRGAVHRVRAVAPRLPRHGQAHAGADRCRASRCGRWRSWRRPRA